MVKIISRSGEEEKFDSKNVEKDLEAAGLPERVAEEVAERVEDRVQDRWTSAKVNEQIDLELKRLEEDIKRAHDSYSNRTMVPEQERTSEHAMTERQRSETFIPEKEREIHEHDERRY